jgi:hypothetical protein
MRALVMVSMLIGCGVEPSDRTLVDDPQAGDDPADAPADGAVMGTRTAASTAKWLATGEYLTWQCEEATHPARPGSGHARNRICSNDLLSTTPDGAPFPVGSATVKELLDGSDHIIGYAFMEKAGASDGGRGWYWYEVVGASTYAASYGSSLCAGCHRGAAHDFVFTVVR